MEFKLTEDQLMCQSSAREFAQRFITKERMEEADRNRRVPDDIFQGMCDAGFAGLIFDPKYGGVGLGMDSYVLTLEQLASKDPSMSAVLVISVMFLYAINLYGTEEQKAKYLPDGIEGKFRGSFAFTEAGTGSDPKQLTTTYKEEGGCFVLNGVKRFISNAGYEGPIILFANDANGENTTAFVFDKFGPGYSLSTPWDTMTCHASPVYDIFLDEVRISKDSVLGGIGGGFKILKGVIAFSKMGVMAQCVGNMGHAYDLAVKYAKEKLHRGKPISKFPTIQTKIAEIAAMHQSCQLLVYRLAEHLNDAKPEDMGAVIAESGMVKGHVADTGFICCQKAMSVLGAYGVCDEYEIERCVRESLQYPCVEGVGDIQRIMCGSYALRP